MSLKRATFPVLLCAAWAAADPLAAQLAVRGETVHTMAGPAIRDGVVLIGADGKIAAVGPFQGAGAVAIPAGTRTLQARVVTPGLVDAHATAGLSGMLNQPHDQDQVEMSAPIQPELRAIDAYNALDPLVAYLRGFGVTTIHTGHSPQALVSGDTLIAKTQGTNVANSVIVPRAMIAVRLGEGVKAAEGKSPGTRSKAIALLRAELVKAREYAAKKERDTNLRSEAFAAVLRGELPLLITVHRAHDIVAALRLVDEFGLRAVLDGVAEAQLVIDEIRASGLPVIVHPTMMRQGGEVENASFETLAKLSAAGIPVALQSGYEGYVPKTRVILFEAAVAAAHGLSFDDALATITIGAARVLGIEKRVGSLEVGKDGDVALFDGDPFEYTSHTTGVVIDGRVVSEEIR
jgi:imidazolonepropionase-like amidohydrolase